MNCQMIIYILASLTVAISVLVALAVLVSMAIEWLERQGMEKSGIRKPVSKRVMIKLDDDEYIIPIKGGDKWM